MALSVKESPLRYSYAKVNLHLKIRGVRPDGFHDLFSLFHLIDLHDDITVQTIDDGNGYLSIEGMPFLPATQNLMGRASRLFLRSINRETDSVHMTIIKRIPLKGGLGGGSSNAATVLLTLNELYDYPLNTDVLLDLAVQIGSDVPFFIHKCPAAVVEGRGEIVRPVPARDDLHALIVIPVGEGISTADAFAVLDRLQNKDISIKRLYEYSTVCHMYRQPVTQWSFSNDFKDVVVVFDEVYQSIYEIGEANRHLYTTVSGSGSSCVFVSDSGPIEINRLDFTEEERTHVINIKTILLNKA
ncbi:MAG: 4-(cytidine 5'-diphospho)-2-C-methyl-D-erythritol kinase [Sphaerochaetaceae bacterium]|nr:4-(cytidine 5'-diphospho)-2-C-methyl-D-erythritol kinase [Sphaerochaetaceae bacterium]